MKEPSTLLGKRTSLRDIQNPEKDHAVIHTHQMNASTVAAAHREVPPILDDMAQIIGPIGTGGASMPFPPQRKLRRRLSAP